MYIFIESFLGTGQYISTLLDNFIATAPECAGGVETAAVEAPGAPEACAAATSGFKIVISSVKTALDTVSLFWCSRATSPLPTAAVCWTSC